MMFYLVLVMLSVFAAAFILAPLLLRNASDEQGRQELNVELFRERIADLDYSDSDAASLEIEARQDLLSDAEGTTSFTKSPSNSRVWIWIGALLVPFFALFIYSDGGLGRGAITDFRLMQELRSLDRADVKAYESLLDELAARASRRPADGELNFYVARSLQSLGRLDEALVIFERLREKFPNDAGLQSAYAEALFLGNNRAMTPDVRRAVDRALSLNPHNTSMLELEGVAAIAQGEREQALTWFRKALATGVSGERADILRRAITNLDSGEQKLIERPEGRSILVQVSVADAVRVPSDAIVFIFARAASGPPAPLAVQRLPVSALPRAVVLDESMSMIQGMGLGDFDDVVVTARLSRSGDVTPKAGDYEARSSLIDMEKIPDQISLVITDPVSL